jgi:hypothetical protein
MKGRTKYGNRPTNGYSSKGEEKRAQELELMQRAGLIRDLQSQVKMEIIPKQDGERAAHYVADWTYTDCLTGAEIIEDFKGFRTPEYVLKRKLVLQRYGIRILETGS